MGKQHVHKELILAWADGAEIEYKSGDKWYLVNTPIWDVHEEYRIKPEPLYPDSSLTDDDLRVWADMYVKNESGIMNVLKLCANAAVKKHCQDQEKEGK